MDHARAANQLPLYVGTGHPLKRTTLNLDDLAKKEDDEMDRDELLKGLVTLHTLSEFETACGDRGYVYVDFDPSKRESKVNIKEFEGSTKVALCEFKKAVREYQGIPKGTDIPENAKYAAMDPNFIWHSFSEKPVYIDLLFGWDGPEKAVLGEGVHLANIRAEDTLQAI